MSKGQRTWSKLSTFPSTIKGIVISWWWWMCFWNMPGINIWKPRRVKRWQKPWLRSWKGVKNPLIFRRMMGRNFTTRCFKNWWNKKAFILFRRVLTWKPVWWNGLTVTWTCTSLCRTCWTLSPSCKICSEGTIACIIAVWRGLLIRWHGPIVRKCERPFLEEKQIQETSFQSRGSSETQQEVHNVQERVSAWLDRKSVCGEKRKRG